jgi:hypothetical protein
MCLLPDGDIKIPRRSKNVTNLGGRAQKKDGYERRGAITVLTSSEFSDRMDFGLWKYSGAEYRI